MPNSVCFRGEDGDSSGLVRHIQEKGDDGNNDEAEPEHGTSQQKHHLQTQIKSKYIFGHKESKLLRGYQKYLLFVK